MNSTGPGLTPCARTAAESAEAHLVSAMRLLDDGGLSLPAVRVQQALDAVRALLADTSPPA